MLNINRFSLALLLVCIVTVGRSTAFVLTPAAPHADCPCPIASSLCACTFNSDYTADITCNIPSGSQIPVFDSSVTICRPYYANKATFLFTGPQASTSFTKDVFAGAKDYWTNINITRSPGNFDDLSLGPDLFTGQQINTLTMNGQIQIDPKSFTGLITARQELSGEISNMAPKLDFMWLEPIQDMIFDLRFDCKLNSLDDITIPESTNGVRELEILGLGTSGLGTKGGSLYAGLDVYGDFNPVLIPDSLSFPNMVNLELDARSSAADSIDIHLTGMPKLESLVVSNFDVSSLPVPFIQTPNSVLNKMVINGLSLTTVDANTFNNLPTLQSLELSRCSLASLDPQLLNGLTVLDTLSLPENKLTDFPAITSTTVNNLDASKNQIKLLKTGALGFITKNVKSQINLSNNIITGIQSGFASNLGLASTIDLSNNHLLTITQSMFTGLTTAGLGILDISHNEIASLGPSSFGTLKVRNIKLSDNSISAVSGGAFTGVGFEGGGVSIDLSNNQIESISKDAFAGITDPGLDTLNLGHNAITQWPQQATLPGIVRTLNLENNQIQKIAANEFQNINAQAIILDANPLNSIGAKAFAGNSMLILSLQGNGKGIQTIDDTAFDGIPTLIRLKINIGKSAPLKLNSLIPADVSKTPLTTMIYTYQFMDSSAVVSSNGNPLTLNGTAVIGCADPTAQNICPQISTDICTSFQAVDTTDGCLCSSLRNLCPSTKK